MKEGIAKTVIGSFLICGATFGLIIVGLTDATLTMPDIAFLGFGIWLLVSGIRRIRKARA